MIVKLGSLISEYSVRNKADENIPVYSVTNEQGFCTGYFSKEVASQDRTTYKIVPRGCFAYNPSRINVGSVDVQECEDRVIVSPLYVVFSVDEKLNRRYLLHYLKSDITLTYIKAYASGSVRDNLKFSILKDFPINLPSAEEQEQIVATLDGIEHLIALRKEELASLDELVKSRFIELFGDPVESDHGWQTQPLESVCKTIVDCPHSTPSYTDEDTGYMCIRTSIVKKNRIMWDEIEYIPEHEYYQRIQRKRPEKGDVVYTREGAILGIAAMIDRECNVALGQRSMLLSPNTAMCLPQFLSAAMNFESFLRKALGGVSGSASPHINVGDIKAFAIILPPMELQEQFAAFVKQTDKSKLAVQKALEELEILKKSLMQQYFG
ncbi:MAG: restriction endonuclease subunit S [Clostridiales bacterium]|nr:restriction endonuclease subunit S [Clostridiales bacterium]